MKEAGKSPTTETGSQVLLLPTWHPAGMMRYKAKAARSFLIHIEKAVEAALGKPRDRDPRVIFNPSPTLARKILSRWKEIAFDIETPSTTSKKILSIAASGEEFLALVWDLERKRNLDLRPLREVFLSNCLKIFQNGEFDVRILEANGFKFKKETKKGTPLLWDTMIEMQILHPDEPANLSYLVSLACDVEAWKHRRKSLERREFLTYNALDANYDWRVFKKGVEA